MKQEILYRFLLGEATPQEERQIEEWLRENPTEHRKELDMVRFIFEGVELYGDDIREELNLGRRVFLPWKKIGRYAMRAAAVAVIAVASGYIAQRYTFDSISSQTNTLKVPRGHRMEIALSDGSNIWLSSGSTLEYPVVFRKNLREIRLSGEALFDVNHKADHPFVVRTFATDIKVLGTRFNVDADEHHRRFTAILLEGSINVTNRINPEQAAIIMKPNDIVKLSHDRLQVGELQNSDAMCWTEGLVNISGLNFYELMTKFEQVFDVNIVIERKTLPNMDKIAGKIRVSDGIENALRILQHTADFSFEKDEETNTVTIL